MSLETFLLLGPVAWYVFVIAATPGPNNAMPTASGINFGLYRTWPHIAGISSGITVLMLLCGIGLGTVFATWPEAQTVLALAVGSPFMAVWALFGAGIARVFQRPKVRRVINWTLAALLIATIPFMFR